MTEPSGRPPVERRRLAVATAAAAGVALVLLLTIVLPAEYGLDPLGTGKLLGLDRLRARSPDKGIDPANAPDVIEEVTARFTSERVLVLRQSGALDVQDRTARLVFPLDLANVTSVEARLDWKDDARTLPDRFELTLSALDGGRSQSVEGENRPDGNGNVSLVMAWISSRAPRANESRVTFDAAEDRSAMGNWSAVVRLGAAGGAPEGGSVLDEGNAWTLTVTAIVYHEEVTALSELSGWDRAVLTLPPQGRVEYKFLLELDAVLEYSWTSTVPVYYDFHGDRGADDPAPQSFREGRTTLANGVFRIPFEGRHGWFWQSFADEPVTITLLTRGDYEILGVV